MRIHPSPEIQDAFDQGRIDAFEGAPLQDIWSRREVQWAYELGRLVQLVAEAEGIAPATAWDLWFLPRGRNHNEMGEA